jgi:protein tyrosine/serine phosphatase
VRMFSREAPSTAQVKHAKELFETIQYPALMHCKSGADRAGAMAVLYKHLKMGLPIADAVEQLGFKYLHVKQGKTGVIDYYFERYLAEANGRTFLEWVETADIKAIKRAYMKRLSAQIPLDDLLRRE